MLRDEELDHIAESQVRAEEHRFSSAGEQLRLALVKHCDVDDPAGRYYSMRVVEPPGDTLFGPGGFFVTRSNGAVEKFGSAELIEALALVYANQSRTPRTITPAVVRMLFRQRSPNAIPELPFDWGTLGE